MGLGSTLNPQENVDIFVVVGSQHIQDASFDLHSVNCGFKVSSVFKAFPVLF